MGKIEIDLTEILGEDERMADALREQIIGRAADRLLADLRKDAKAEIRQTLERAVQVEVRDIVRRTLTEPIQRTTPWGEQQGVATSVLEIAREQLTKYATARGQNFDRRSSSDLPANLDELVSDVVRRAMRGELAEVVAETRERVRTAIAEAIGPQLTSAIQDAVKPARR